MLLAEPTDYSGDDCIETPWRVDYSIVETTHFVFRVVGGLTAFPLTSFVSNLEGEKENKRVKGKRKRNEWNGIRHFPSMSGALSLPWTIGQLWISNPYDSTPKLGKRMSHHIHHSSHQLFNAAETYAPLASFRASVVTSFSLLHYYASQGGAEQISASFSP